MEKLRSTRFWVVWTIAFSALVPFEVQAQGDFEIDDEGNIILLDKKDEAPGKKPPPKRVAPPKKQKPSPAKVRVRKRTRSKKRLVQEIKAVIIAKTAQVKRDPSPQSTNVVLLRAGDKIQVIQQGENLSKVKYLLEDQFPVEGWLPNAAFRTLKTNEAAPGPLETQEYTPESRDQKVITQVQQIPSEELPEQAELPDRLKRAERLPDRKPSSTNRRRPISSEPFRLKERGTQTNPWFGSFGIFAGINEFKEKVSTLDANDNRANLVNYKISGPQFGFKSFYGYQYPEYRFGGRLDYAITLFDTTIGGGSSNVGGSNIQAQLHDAKLGAFGSKRWNFKKWGYDFGLEPEAQLSFNFQMLDTNQLLTNALDSNGNSLNFPVLFGYQAYYSMLEITPRAYLPFRFVLEPRLGVTLFYMFTELDTRDFGAQGQLRTGKPAMSMFDLSYGVDLSWNLAPLRVPGQIKAGVHSNTFNRKFSGAGNRAARATRSAKSKIETFVYTFGYDYLF